MYNKQTGDVVCDWCGEFIGNINGDYNFFSLIKVKYCPKCKEFVHKQQIISASKAYRRRKKAEKKALEEKVKLLEQENKLLRERNISLKNNQEEY